MAGILEKIGALGKAFTSGISGFAAGSQPGAKVQGSYQNNAYNSANQDFNQNLGTALGTGAGSYTEQAVQAPQILPQAQADPYAQYGGQAAYNALVSQFGNQKQGILDSINQRTGQEAQNYGYGVEDLFNSSKTQQDAINQKSAQNELAKMQGRTDILGKVSRGTRSAGVMLGQKNASNSSAAQAIANAYGDIGNRDLQKVEQGYAVNNEGIATDQQNFDLSRTTNARRLEDSKTNIVNNIVTEATSALQDLDAKIAGASLPQRIAIEQEKNRIRQDASGRLSAFDAQLNQARSLQGYNPDQRREEAQRLSQLGRAADQPFQYSQEDPLQAQSQFSPAGGNLPLYSLPKRRLA